MIKDKLIEIGTLGSTHRLTGEMKLKINKDLSLNEKLDDKPLFFMVKDDYEVRVVEYSKVVSKKLIVKFKNFDHINSVQGFEGQTVFARVKDNRVTELYSIIGFEVIENGKHVGVVVDELFNGLQDLALVKTDEDKEFYIPLVERYLINEDAENKVLTVKDSEQLKPWNLQ